MKTKTGVVLAMMKSPDNIMSLHQPPLNQEHAVMYVMIVAQLAAANQEWQSCLPSRVAWHCDWIPQNSLH